MKSCFLYCTSFILLFFCFAQPVSARIIFEDHFDEQDLSGWKVVQNFQWMNPLQPCMNGTTPAAWQLYLQQLGIRIFGPGCFTEIVPIEFQIPLKRSYTFEFDMTLPESTDMDRNYTLRYVDSRNAYAMKVLGNRIFLEKLVDGQGWGVNGSSTQYPFQVNGTYHIKNEINADHAMRVYINNELVLSYIDTAPFLDGGTIGFRASVGAIPNSVTWFDNAIVELTDATPPIPVPYVSQRDPEWKSELYDHTAQTIERLGCAISSAVMVLKFYGITEVSLGIPLTPKTLNDWLIQQKDGYINQGLVNWIAITRLASQFHHRNPQTPSLEYLRKPSSESDIQNEFDHNRPPIAQLSGHFVVGTLYDFHQLSIQDPYDFEKHFVPFSSILSLRTFTPSFTDLRYIQITAPPDVSFTISNGTNLWHSYLEYAIHPEESQDTSVPVAPIPIASVIEIPKPEYPTYTLHIESNAIKESDIIINRYDSKVNPTQTTLHVFSDQYGADFTIPFSETNQGNITRIVHDNTLSQSLDRLWKLKHIRTPDFYVALRIAIHRFTESSDLAEKKKLLHVVKYYLESYPTKISEEGKRELLEVVDQIAL